MSTSVFGPGTGRIWLERVMCTGNERELLNCTTNTNGGDSCTHAQDAAVMCQSTGEPTHLS